MEKVISKFIGVKLQIVILFFSLPFFDFGQFAGSVGDITTSAIAKDSSVIVSWANACTVTRGWLNITDQQLGQASFGTDSDAIGPADGTSAISLGDSGIAILTFPHPIFNGTGPDFVIFENSFSDSFLELGHVEVSSDGINFHRFSSDFLGQSTVQNGPFDQFGEAEKINNLAGKYRGGYGTPFDLEELSGIIGLNINAITHVKIIDAIGSIDSNQGSVDQNGNPINDPFPTAFESGGLDLEAVGVCHMQSVNSLGENEINFYSIYPNPAHSELNVEIRNGKLQYIEIYSVLGEIVLRSVNSRLNIRNLSPGIYQLKVNLFDGRSVSKQFVKL